MSKAITIVTKFTKIYNLILVDWNPDNIKNKTKAQMQA